MGLRKSAAQWTGTLLVAVGVILGAGSAWAGNTTVTNLNGSGSNSASAYTTSYSPQNNTGVAINAAVLNASAAETISSDPLNPTGTTSVQANTIAALAAGNSNVTDVSMGVLGPIPVPAASWDQDGIGLLDYSVNDTTQVTSSVTASSLSQTLDDFTVGTAVLSNNVITAQTTLNSENASVHGPVPLGYTPSTDNADFGDVFVFYGQDAYYVDGSIAVANGQVNIGSGAEAGSQASVDSTYPPGSIFQSIQPTAGPETVTSSPDTSHNTVSAIFFGNTADNSALLETGTATAFNGGISLSNFQVNQDSATTPLPMASNTNSIISSAVQNDYCGPSCLVYLETFTGTLTLNSNTISSQAIDNSTIATGPGGTTGNVISLADGLDYSDVALQAQDNFAVYEFSPVVQLGAVVAGDITLENFQINDQNSFDAQPGPTALGAVTLNGLIYSWVDDINGGAVETNNNAITSTSTGAQAYNAILAGGPNTATFDGVTAMLSLQHNDHTAITAVTGDPAIGSYINTDVAEFMFDTTFTHSSVELNGNTIGAYANAGEATNVISLGATTLTTDSVVFPVQPAVLVTRDGSVGATINTRIVNGTTIQNMQNSFGGDGAEVTATNNGATIVGYESFNVELLYDTITTNANSAEAIARANEGASAILLTATTLNGSAGILNVQTSDAPVMASVVQGSSIGLDAAQSIGNNAPPTTASDGSSFNVDSNLMRALAYGNDGGSNITANATTLNAQGDGGHLAAQITITAGDALPFDDESLGQQPMASAAFMVLSDQETGGNVTATVNSLYTDGPQWYTPLYLDIDAGGPGPSSIVDSHTFLDANAVVAAARGNLASNGVTLGATTYATEGAVFGVIASVDNIQEIPDGVDITATLQTGTTGNSVPVIETVLSGAVSGSASSTSNNLLTTIAEGNDSTNTLEASGTTIDDPSTVALTGSSLTVASATQTNIHTDAAFAITNAQFGGSGERDAYFNNELDAAAAVHVYVGGMTTDSSLTASGNIFKASALNNTETSTLSFDPVTLDTSAAINNFQLSAANVDAIDLAGRDPLGVEIQVIDTITNSHLNADHTLFDADATGNAATGTLNARATTIIDGSDVGGTTNATLDETNGASAIGTFALLSNQFLIDGSIEAAGNTSVSIVGAANILTTGSALSVSDNAAQVVALGNTADNGVTVTMINGPGKGNQPTASLMSFQTDARGNSNTLPSVDANTHLDVASIGQVDGSSVTMDGNTNLALAEVNDVTNTLSASAGAALESNSGNGGNANYDETAGPTWSATADYALTSFQLAVGTVGATANTNVGNNDSGGTQTTTDSQLSLSNNITTAEADADRASNTLALSADSTLGAGGALTNGQSNFAAVTANAASNVSYDTGRGFNTSTVAANGNGTTALANGNVASSALNADAGAPYNGTVLNAASSVTGATGTPVLNATAQYALLNAQGSYGPVSATVGGGVNVTLGATGGVSGSSATVSGNTFLAQATGNGAANTINMTALVGGTPSAALTNYQDSEALAVTATASSVSIGITASGVSDSNMAVNNNHITAAATANSAVNVVTAH